MTRYRRGDPVLPATLPSRCPHPPPVPACLSSPFSSYFHAAGRSGRDGRPTARRTSKAGRQNPPAAAAGPIPVAGEGDATRGCQLYLGGSHAVSGIQRGPGEAMLPDFPPSIASAELSPPPQGLHHTAHPSRCHCQGQRAFLSTVKPAQKR